MKAAPRVSRVAVAAAAVMMVLAPSARRASAQTATRTNSVTTPSEQSQGPLVVTPIPRRVVFTPDVKVTTVNGRTSTFVGGSAGIEIDDRFFIGGAAYGMVAPLDTATMFYGGLLTGYRLVGDDNVAITVRGLIGFGQANVYASFDGGGGPYPVPHGRYGPAYGYYPYGYGYPYVWNGFFVAEPEVNASVSITRAARLTVGASYRATAGFYGPESQINGFAGTFGIQFRF
jgi:hypothetical protein